MDCWSCDLTVHCSPCLTNRQDSCWPVVGLDLNPAGNTSACKFATLKVALLWERSLLHYVHLNKFSSLHATSKYTHLGLCLYSSEGSN